LYDPGVLGDEVEAEDFYALGVESTGQLGVAAAKVGDERARRERGE
jgi:hypothetical protein